MFKHKNMFSDDVIAFVVLILFFVVIFSVVQSLGFLVFAVTSLLTLKVFFKNIEEFKNGVVYFFTPRILEKSKDSSKQDLPGEGKFLVWFFLNLIIALTTNSFFGWD